MRDRAVRLDAERLTAEAFAPYGEVIEASGNWIPINQGQACRYPDLARIDVTAEGGRVALSRVVCVGERMPVRLRLMERHPLSSQAFVPVSGQRYLIVVAPSGRSPAPAELRAFVAEGTQGINYRRGTWHHPMLALADECEFLEIHRVGPGENCDEVKIDTDVEVFLPPGPFDAQT